MSCTHRHYAGHVSITGETSSAHADAMTSTPCHEERCADPTDTWTAVVHPEPWAWYRLLADSDVHLDEESGSWVVARPDDVAAVLSSAAARVRPLDQPVPTHLDGTPAGALFSRMMRMRDGVDHGVLRRVIEPALASIEPRQLAAAIERAAATVETSIAGTVAIIDDVGVAEAWMDRFPAATIAALLGVTDDAAAEVVDAAHALARAFAPGAGASTTRAADDAVGTFSRRWASMAGSPIVRSMERSLDGTGGLDVDVLQANVAGWFFQTVDACAGAIGAALERRVAHEHGWDAIVRHVLAVTPPVHNTRRFLVDDLDLPSGRVPRGATVTLVLVGAAIDGGTAFGSGAHRCPSHGFAPAVIAAGAAGAWGMMRSPERVRVVGFRPSSNVRIPCFAGGRP